METTFKKRERNSLEVGTYNLRRKHPKKGRGEIQTERNSSGQRHLETQQVDQTKECEFLQNPFIKL